MGLIGLCFVAPLDRSAWSILAMSIVVHALYHSFLLLGFRIGDLSHVYPIARGTAPLLVAVLSALYANEVPTPMQGVALLVVSVGIFLLAFPGGETVRDLRPVIVGLATAAMIGTYTVLDGLGVRSTMNPFSYVAWIFVFDGIPVLAVCIWRRGSQLFRTPRRDVLRGIVGGVLGTLGFTIVLWAMSQGPLAYVASLRETSVVFAAWIGSRFLGEPLGKRRLAASAIVATGVIWLSLLTE